MKLTHQQLIQMHERAIGLGRIQPDFTTSCRYFYIASRILKAAIELSYKELT